MYCKNCGTQLEDTAQFCTMCGSPVFRENPQIQQPIRTTGKGIKITAIVLSVCLAVSVVFNLFATIFCLRNMEEPPSDTAVTTTSSTHIEMVDEAIDALKEKWVEIYDENSNLLHHSDGYLEIYHTRMIKLLPNIEDEVFVKMTEGKTIEYIVEFSLLSDYHSSAPYYTDIGMYDSVIFYTDGTIEVSQNDIFSLYSALAYSYDYSDIVEEVTDLSTKYNQSWHLDY